VVLTKTRCDRTAAIGVRRAPAPDGRPGFVRIDSVHQGNFDGIKGLYHINAVDCVTQWEVVASAQTISEAHLLPVIEKMLEQFPFEILGFHADNGSECDGGFQACPGDEAFHLFEEPLAPGALLLQGALGAGKAALVLGLMMRTRLRSRIEASPDNSAFPELIARTVSSPRVAMN
jgi:hypothetical protein